MSPPFRPRTIADIQGLLARLPGPDQTAAAVAAAREPQLTKPPGSLGRLEALSAWLAAWQGRHPPAADRIRVLVFAGNHGVAARGVSAYPAAVTAQMVANFHVGGAAINQLAAAVGAGLGVHALALDRPTDDFTEGAAMDEVAFMDAFVVGMTAVEDGTDLLCLGEMGIGNSTAAAAVACALFGGDAASWTGPGTGVEGSALARKAHTVESGLRLHRGVAQGPLDLLRRLGGREMAAIAGAAIAARLARVPVVLDGFICCAAVAPLHAACAGALDHCLAGHVSAEPGHARLLAALGLTPLLDLGLRLGEGTGAVLAATIVKGAAACHAGMATFAQAGVSERDG